MSLPPSDQHFNWVFLVELIVFGIVSLFFLFYFNRVFAQIISILIRLYLRCNGYSQYIDVQSLQISLLAGRIFFGKVIYHGPNETITIVGGHVTWRYWLRRVRHVTLNAGDATPAEKKSKDSIPCRILVELKGLQWFVYNRSPAYDYIETQMRAGPPQQPSAAPTANKGDSFSDDTVKDDSDVLNAETISSRPSNLTLKHASATEQTFEDVLANSPYLKMLPIKIECNRGAVVMGNDDTPSILVAHFEKAHGLVDATKSRSVDRYKQLFDLSFDHPVVQLKNNKGFKEPLVSHGDRLLRVSSDPLSGHTSNRHRRRRKLRDLIPLFGTSNKSLAPTEMQSSTDQRPGEERWKGLSRYLDESDGNEGARVEPAEYAIVPTIADCTRVKMCLYWDQPGPVAYSTQPQAEKGFNINGTQHPSPEYGVDLSVEGGTIHYGPWADRQRVHLQNMFAPKLYKSAVPSVALSPGNDRQYTEFKVFMELSSSTILRVPLRESSKDWKYRRRLDEGETRAGGWIEAKVAAESTVSYTQAQVASSNGWTNTLEVELRSPEVRSSVNHGLLWKAELQTIRGDLSGPLKWNDDTEWGFDIVSRGIQVFILRDHITLLTDLVTDWTSGPTADYWTFVPMIYNLNLRFEDFGIYINVNDQNIINKPDDTSDNTFVILRSRDKDTGWLNGNVNMDFREYRPQSSTVCFSARMDGAEPEARILELCVGTPIWNTWNAFLKTNKDVLGQVRYFKLAGSYDFFANTSSQLIDTLNLDVDMQGVDLTLHGFLIRFFLTKKENYFGENMHFKTLEEWQNQQTGTPSTAPPVVKTNDLDVILSVAIQDGTVRLPKNIYSATDQIWFEIPSVDVDMRFTNYYMDLQINSGPITSFLENGSPKRPQVFVHSLDLYGHRLFGLPPTEPTYVCNWDINVGAVEGECIPAFLQTLIVALKTFIFSVEDVENALPVSNETTIYDVTFLRLNVAPVKVWLLMDETNAFRFTAAGISVVLNDLANKRHSQRITLDIPGFTLACMAPRQQDYLVTKGYIDTDIVLTVFGRKKHASTLKRLQKTHIQESDHRTSRAHFLLERDGVESGDSSSLLDDPPETDPPSMTLPGLPLPIHQPFGSSPSSVTGYRPSTRTASSSSLSRKSSRSFLTGKQPPSLKHSASFQAPSFYSAYESQPDLLFGTPAANDAFTSHPSPAATTPRSRSSKRARTALRSHQYSSSTFPRSVPVISSSAFSVPKFAFTDVVPNLENMPDISIIHTTDIQDEGDMNSGPEIVADEEEERDSIVIEFTSGIKGFCCPETLSQVAHLLGQIQAKTPEDLLDCLQVSVLSKLQKVVKNIPLSTTVLEACVKLPQLNFRFVNTAPSLVDRSDGYESSGDSYLVQLHNLVLTARSKTMPTPSSLTQQNAATPKQTISAHILLDSLELSLSTFHPARMPALLPVNPALRILFRKLLLWTFVGDNATGLLQFETVLTYIETKQALFLYEAIQRMVGVAKKLAREFGDSNDVQARTQKLVLDLATAGERWKITHDPSSLTRPSYVLRSASSHVRLNDTWKINTRLRHVWHSLSDAARSEWTQRYLETQADPPADAQQEIVGVLERWRGWELTSIQESLLIRQVFGKQDGKKKREETGDAASKALSVNFKLGVEAFAVVMDPGPAQNEFAIDHISSTVAIGNSPSESGETLTTGVLAKSIIQIHSHAVRLGLSWEVLDIFETVLKLLQEHKGRSRVINGPPSSLKKQGGPSGGLHILASTDTGVLKLDTVNLHVMSTMHNFAASAVLVDKNVEVKDGVVGNLTTAYLHADMITSEICHGNKVLCKTTLRNPKTYAHLDEHWLAATRFQIWKLSGSCEDLDCDIREQVLGLMEVIDYIVTDEVSQINTLMGKLDKVLPSPVDSPVASLQRDVNIFHISLSLERFALGAALLPSLAYLVRGGGVRLSAKPNAKDSKEMFIDVDVTHHEHEMRLGSGTPQTRSISVLKLPAINGSIRNRSTEEERLFEILICVHMIRLDASSIQSLFNAFNKPEVVKVIDSARAEGKAIGEKFEEIFGSSNVSSKVPVDKTTSGPPLVYAAQVSVAGVQIQTAAPLANLDINLGAIRMQASNKSAFDSSLLLFAEIHLEFEKITVELTRTTVRGSQDQRCGYLELHASLAASSDRVDSNSPVRTFTIKSRGLKVDLFADTASTVVDVAGHLQDKLKDLDLSREVKYLRKLRKSRPLTAARSSDEDASEMNIFASAVSVELINIQIAWIVGGQAPAPPKLHQRSDLVLSFKRIYFATVLRKENEAQLIIEEFLLQLVDQASNKSRGRTLDRSENSALLPEVVFKVAYHVNASERRLAFQARGSSLNLLLTSSCVVAVNTVQTSIATAAEKFRKASATWKSTPTESGVQRKNIFGSKRLASVLIDADFGGAVVHIRNASDDETATGAPLGQHGRYEQFLQSEMAGHTTLRSPGLAFKVEYVDLKTEDPSLSAEIKISASSNTLNPSVVPLIMDMSDSIKEVMNAASSPKDTGKEPTAPDKPTDKTPPPNEDKAASSNPAAILGRCRLNIGLRICEQQFTLNCQPIARVAASAGYRHIYVTINTCDDQSTGRFYAMSLTINGLLASLQHVYSSESAGQIQVDSVELSLMNSKRVLGSQGLSCIMKCSPIKSVINAKQFQDFLLFKKVWLPETAEEAPAVVVEGEPSTLLVQRYHKVAATKAFPWNTTMAVPKIDLQLDLGSGLGRTSLVVSGFWATSRKTSDWEQALCLGFEEINVSSIGRLSGFVDLQNVRVRTSINWGSARDDTATVQTPLIEASLGFKQLRVQTSFEYQTFLIADITDFHFLMYNVQDGRPGASGDRLVGILEGDKVQVFCTTLSASQGLALYQAFQRLVKEKMEQYESSLEGVERYLGRRFHSDVSFPTPTLNISAHKETSALATTSTLSLHTKVVVNLKEVNIGVFPSTFYDTQVFKLEALNPTARFYAEMVNGKIHSMLQMTLGRLRIALASVRRMDVGRLSSDTSVEEVIVQATGARGGTIVKVPQVNASMHTWNRPGSTHIDYIFKSAFEGQVDVGWNFSRVGFIKQMYHTHVKALAQRQGKAPPNSRITMYTGAVPGSGSSSGSDKSIRMESEAESKSELKMPKDEATKKEETGKITAVVDVPQSKYEYNALEPPVIETPQLRDMGEATPPLEWIGLNRDRLPNVTHQIVIVSLLEVAREVEDAYAKILGSTV